MLLRLLPPMSIDRTPVNVSGYEQWWERENPQSTKRSVEETFKQVTLGDGSVHYHDSVQSYTCFDGMMAAPTHQFCYDCEEYRRHRARWMGKGIYPVCNQ
jgi:hypothetical protein